MANIISLSISDRNKQYCIDKHVKKSALFAESLELHRRMFEFSNLYNIIEYYDLYNDMIRKINVLQKEIVRRSETIEALQDVLVQKEINERRK